MAVNLCKITHLKLRVPVNKVNFMNAPFVTKFSAISVSKNQISFNNFYNLSKPRVLYSKFVFPGDYNLYNTINVVFL